MNEPYSSDCAVTLDDLRSRLATAAHGFSCDRITMREAVEWRLHEGVISHVSGGYFSVVGVDRLATEEPPQVLLFQPQSAFNGLLVDDINGELHVLLQTRVEPGNVGIAQFGPTVQSTPANYSRVHGGRATPYLEYFHRTVPGLRVIGDWTELDLGGRYLFKNKRLVCVAPPGRVTAAENFVWAPARVMAAALRESAFCNTDLRSLLAVMPWDQWPATDRDTDLGLAAHASLAMPVRADAIGRILGAIGRGARSANIVPLEALAHWHVTDEGLFEQPPHRQGFDVGFYRVHAPTREVHTWTQPLVKSRSTGCVVLALAITDGALHVLVQVRGESGLSTGAAVFPSHVAPPGHPRTAADNATYEALQECRVATVSTTVESDEGGRFFQDESTFEVFVTDEAADLGEHFHWLRLSELKCLLSLSNTCALQLRCIASVLLALL